MRELSVSESGCDVRESVGHCENRRLLVRKSAFLVRKSCIGYNEPYKPYAVALKPMQCKVRESDWVASSRLALPVASLHVDFRSTHCACLREEKRSCTPRALAGDVVHSPCHARPEPCRPSVQIQSQVSKTGQQPARCDAACLLLLHQGLPLEQALNARLL